jgi:hypothetical protein
MVTKDFSEVVHPRGKQSQKVNATVPVKALVLCEQQSLLCYLRDTGERYPLQPASLFVDTMLVDELPVSIEKKPVRAAVIRTDFGAGG